MKSFTTTVFSLLCAALISGCIPTPAHAAKLFIAPPEQPLRVGDTSLLTVMIDTEGEEINATEGTLVFDSAPEIKTVSTGGSIFDLWPRKPSLVADTLSFTGGTTAGVYGPRLKLFTFAITPETTASLSISFKEITAYKNDGQGTKISSSGISSTFTVAANTDGTVSNELANLIIEDTTPPEPFSIDVGFDKALYGEKYFISFYTTDAQSGVNRYEVKENDRPLVRSGNVYVLQDQRLTGYVEVRAIDNAGNARVHTLQLEARYSWITITLLLLGGLIICVVIYILFRKKR